MWDGYEVARVGRLTLPASRVAMSVVMVVGMVMVMDQNQQPGDSRYKPT